MREALRLLITVMLSQSRSAPAVQIRENRAPDPRKVAPKARAGMIKSVR